MPRFSMAIILFLMHTLDALEFHLYYVTFKMILLQNYIMFCEAVLGAVFLKNYVRLWDESFHFPLIITPACYIIKKKSPK